MMTFVQSYCTEQCVQATLSLPSVRYLCFLTVCKHVKHIVRNMTVIANRASWSYQIQTVLVSNPRSVRACVPFKQLGSSLERSEQYITGTDILMYMYVCPTPFLLHVLTILPVAFHLSSLLLSHFNSNFNIQCLPSSLLNVPCGVG